MAATSPKERIAIKRRLKYRTNEAYRQKVIEKSKLSKKRPEYKQSQREYNRLYYQRRKEELKKKRGAQKSFNEWTDPELEYTVEQVVEGKLEAHEAISEDKELFYYVTVEESEDGSILFPKEDKESVETIIENISEIRYHSTDANNTDCYSYPKVELKPRGRRKGMVKSTADKMIQVDLDDPPVKKKTKRPKSPPLYQIDMGIQCSPMDFANM